MKKAFTIIELVFAVVILGILAGIAIPKLTSVRTDAQSVASLNELTTIIKTLQAEYLKNSNSWPKAVVDGTDAKAQNDWIAQATGAQNLEWANHSAKDNAPVFNLKVGKQKDCLQITLIKDALKISNNANSADCKALLVAGIKSGILAGQISDNKVSSVDKETIVWVATSTDALDKDD